MSFPSAERLRALRSTVCVCTPITQPGFREQRQKERPTQITPPDLMALKVQPLTLLPLSDIQECHLEPSEALVSQLSDVELQTKQAINLGA